MIDYRTIFNKTSSFIHYRIYANQYILCFDLHKCIFQAVHTLISPYKSQRVGEKFLSNLIKERNKLALLFHFYVLVYIVLCTGVVTFF